MTNRTSATPIDELVEDVTWMLDGGETSVDAIARRVHTTPGSLERRLYRAGREDLVARLERDRDRSSSRKQVA